VREFRLHGADRAGEAKTIQMRAVYVQGRDNYDRPDFSRRTDLLKLSGAREQFLGLSDADLADWDRLKQSLSAETVF
jgi:hypothetical protein